MKKKYLSNYIYNVLYRVVTSLATVLVIPHITRSLGVIGNGIASETNTIIQWIAIIATLGVSLYGEKKIAEVRDDREKMSITLWEIVSLRFLTIIVVSVLSILFFSVFHYHYLSILMIQSGTLVALAIDITFLYVGNENFKTIALRNIVFKIVNVVLIIMYVKKPEDVGLYVFINIITAVIGNLSLWLRIKELVDFVKPSMEGILSHFVPNFIMFIPQIAINVYTLLNKLVLSYIAGEAQLAFYDKADSIIKMFLFVVTSVSLVMWPRLVNVQAKKETEEANRLINAVLKITLLIAIPMTVGIAGVAPYFASWYMGEEFALVGNLMVMFAPIIIIISMNQVLGFQCVIPAGFLKYYTHSVYLAAVVNIIANLIFISTLGAYGAIIASLLAELSTLIYLIYRSIKIVQFENILRNILTYTISAIAMYVVVNRIGYYMGARFITNVLQVGVGVIVYFVFLFILKDEYIHQYISGIFKKG